MKHKIILLMSLLILLASVGCGGENATQPTSIPLTQMSQPTPVPTQTPATETRPIDVPPTENLPTEVPAPEASASACESYFQFCVTATVSGTVNTTATAGMGSSFGNDCTAWAAGGDPRVLDLPMMLAAGEQKLTVALTRLGMYTGPGSYEVVSVSTSGIPDMFPALEVAGRTFSNGEGTSAVVTIAPDGSGSVLATGLVEIASIQVANPDPNARVDFSMTWTCQEEE